MPWGLAAKSRGTVEYFQTSRETLQHLLDTIRTTSLRQLSLRQLYDVPFHHIVSSQSEVLAAAVTKSQYCVKKTQCVTGNEGSSVREDSKV